jgi:hypothetical protein
VISIQYIQDNGYPVKQMWECDWERLKKAVKAFVKDMQRPCDGQLKMAEETILRAVMEDRMLGALEVDMELFFKQPWCPLIVGCMLWSVVPVKPVHTTSAKVK